MPLEKQTVESRDTKQHTLAAPGKQTSGFVAVFPRNSGFRDKYCDPLGPALGSDRAVLRQMRPRPQSAAAGRERLFRLAQKHGVAESVSNSARLWFRCGAISNPCNAKPSERPATNPARSTAKASQRQRNATANQEGAWVCAQHTALADLGRGSHANSQSPLFAALALLALAMQRAHTGRNRTRLFCVKDQGKRPAVCGVSLSFHVLLRVRGQQKTTRGHCAAKGQGSVPRAWSHVACLAGLAKGNHKSARAHVDSLFRWPLRRCDARCAAETQRPVAALSNGRKVGLVHKPRTQLARFGPCAGFQFAKPDCDLARSVSNEQAPRVLPLDARTAESLRLQPDTSCLRSQCFRRSLVFRPTQTKTSRRNCFLCSTCTQLRRQSDLGEHESRRTGRDAAGQKYPARRFRSLAEGTFSCPRRCAFLVPQAKQCVAGIVRTAACAARSLGPQTGRRVSSELPSCRKTPTVAANTGCRF